jgi:allantoin racemase
MPNAQCAQSRYRFQLIGAFSAPAGSPLHAKPFRREEMLNNFDAIAHLLQDVAWEAHPGLPAPYGDWAAVTREEFSLIGVNRLSLVREACRGGAFNAIILLGGADPGFPEAREIGHGFGVPVIACAHAQMIVACMLGYRFSIICISESHNLRMADLVVQYRLAERCASICNLDFPLPRPSFTGTRSIMTEKRAIENGLTSEFLDLACAQAVAAIEQDGAETIMLGCSAIYWLQPHLTRRLAELGWDIPVLEGHGCAIAQAKLLVDLKLDASGIAIPRDPPGHSRSRKPV